MSSVFFVIKVAIVTFFLVGLMQVEVGDRSIETHSHQFIVEASKKLKLNEVAIGILRFAKEAKQSTENIVSEFWHRTQNLDTRKKTITE